MSPIKPSYRKGSYAFKDGSLYQGEWGLGWMHGSGVLTRERDILDGHWDAERKVGWGRIKVGPVTRISSWKLKNGELSTADEEGMWLSDVSQYTRQMKHSHIPFRMLLRVIVISSLVIVQWRRNQLEVY